MLDITNFCLNEGLNELALIGVNLDLRIKLLNE
jgi:hypothetical protein